MAENFDGRLPGPNSTAEDHAEPEMSNLQNGASENATTLPPAVLPHRSHDPQYNMKRSDPFQFGSRYLGQEDDVYEFNAWDHVETDDVYKEYAEMQYAKQRESPVSEFDQSKHNIFGLYQFNPALHNLMIQIYA